MPDAFVFPGGAVDASDRDLGPELAVAALRELFEEAGILLARDPHGLPVALQINDLSDLRHEIAAGRTFAGMLERHGLVPDTSALVYYSNWITPASEPIRFDAHFFLARAPSDQTATADASEVHDGVWLTARDALAAADRAELNVRFPTRKHLERLARYPTIDDVFAHARDRAIQPVSPVERADGSYVFDEDAW